MNCYKGFISSAFLGLCQILALVTAAGEYEPMLRSLKTFQVHACEGKELKIHCPQDTVISIRYVRYGRPAGHSAICDPFLETASSTYIESSEMDESCSSQEAVKVITKTCHRQLECRIFLSAITFQENPCPNVRKYAEVVYKCHPKEFSNRMSCSGKTSELRCASAQRILIFSASYGNLANGPNECAESDISKVEKCESKQATETAINICTGKQHCSLAAKSEIFGKTGCSSTTIEQLKVAFACVPTEVLRSVGDRFSTINGLFDGNVIHTTSYPAWADNIDFEIPLYLLPEKEDSVRPTSFGEMQQDSRVASNKSEANERRIVGLLQLVAAAQKFVSKNRQKLVLYLTLSLGVGFTFFAMVVFLYHYLQGAFKQQEEKLNVPPITEDFFSESDLENYEGETSLNTDSNTMSRKISETIPRAPISNGPETNHFFS